MTTEEVSILFRVRRNYGNNLLQLELELEELLSIRRNIAPDTGLELLQKNKCLLYFLRMLSLEGKTNHSLFYNAFTIFYKHYEITVRCNTYTVCIV